MALLVENGSGVTGADSYISVADFETFCASIGVTLTGNNGTSEQVLTLAFMDMEQSSYKGVPVFNRERPLWPRSGVYLTRDYLVPSDEIPKALKDLQCFWAIEIDAGRDPRGYISRAIKREKVDVIEVEYMDNATPFEISRRISDLKAKLTQASSGGMVVPLFRA